MNVKYPNVKVRLSGTDGNAFSIIGKVAQALRRAGVSAEEQAAFRKAAMSADYDNVLVTAMRWVDVT